MQMLVCNYGYAHDNHVCMMARTNVLLSAHDRHRVKASNAFFSADLPVKHEPGMRAPKARARKFCGSEHKKQQKRAFCTASGSVFKALPNDARASVRFCVRLPTQHETVNTRAPKARARKFANISTKTTKKCFFAPHQAVFSKPFKMTLALKCVFGCPPA